MRMRRKAPEMDADDIDKDAQGGVRYVYGPPKLYFFYTSHLSILKLHLRSAIKASF